MHPDCFEYLVQQPCVFCVLCFPDYITTINGLTLISSGPLTNESTITLCANSIRYLIFMECSVEKSNNMFWKLNPIFNSVSYNADSREGLEILRSHIKLTLTKKEGETEQISFTSQFQAFSDELYDTIERYGVVLKVSCGTAGRESKEIRIEAQGTRYVQKVFILYEIAGQTKVRGIVIGCRFPPYAMSV